MLDAVELVLRGKYATTFSVIRPPGHHAGRDGNAMDAPSQGFCLFNNAAVGALRAKQLMDARIASVSSPAARSHAIASAAAAGHRILVYDVLLLNAAFLFSACSDGFPPVRRSSRQRN